MKKLLIGLFVLIAVATATALTLGPFPADAQADPVWWNEFGYVLAEQGDLIGAQDAFYQAVLLDPSYENARKNHAVAAFKNEDYQTAIAEWHVLVAEHDTQEYHFDLAQALVAQARYKETDASAMLAQLNEALAHLDAAGDWPHAQENAVIVRNVLAQAISS